MKNVVRQNLPSGLIETTIRQHRVLLEPRRQYRELKKWLDWALPPRPAGMLGDLEAPALLHPTRPDAVERATKYLERMPRRETLEAAATQFAETLEQKVDNSDIAILVGFLLDSYPNSNPANLEVYTASLEYAVGEERRLSAQVVADAATELLVGSRFVPTVNELLAACDASQAKYKHALGQAGRLILIRESACDVLLEFDRHEILDAFDPMPDWEGVA